MPNNNISGLFNTLSIQPDLITSVALICFICILLSSSGKITPPFVVSWRFTCISCAGTTAKKLNNHHTSSLAMRMSSFTLEKTVGSMKKPFKPKALPPHSSLAPSLMPLWMNSSTRFWCSRLTCGTRDNMWKTQSVLEGQKKKRLQMCPPHLWALLGCGVEGTAHYPPLGSLHAPPNKLVIDGLLNKNARPCCAALACVEKHALVGLLHSQIHCRTNKI